MNEELVDSIKEAFGSNKNIIIRIVNSNRCGKSYMALRLAELYEKRFKEKS